MKLACAALKPQQASTIILTPVQFICHNEFVGAAMTAGVPTEDKALGEVSM